MPMATATSAELEVLTFLSDPNAQVRQVALSNIVGFSAKGSSHRSLLTDKHKGNDGKPLKGRDGKDVDTIEDLKKLCKDQPITAHDAFSALINLTDSLLVTRRVGDAEFLEFLVSYIADPVSLLADLACMLLSNLTKLESICGTLLSLSVPARPFYNFFSAEDAQASLAGLDADPSSPDFEQRRREAAIHAAAISEATQKAEEKVPAMARLLDAFEEGAAVENQGSGIEAMRKRALEVQEAQDEQKKEEQSESSAQRPQIKRKANCNFLASVFANVTVIPKGRQWFVTPLSTSTAATSTSAQAAARRDTDAAVAPPALEYPVARIMAFTEHPELIRRGGVVSALKNILFIKTAHKLLIAPPPAREGEEPMLAGALRATSRPPSSIDLLPYLLLPLIEGKEMSEVDLEDQEALPESCQFIDEDKKREPDPALRLMLVESLLLLCTGLYGRQCLRARGAYVVVRAAHLKETDDKIAESVLRLVNIIQRDESSETAQLEEEGVDLDVGAEQVREEADSDDVDMVIEEL